MPRLDKHWIVIADEHAATLFRCDKPDGRNWRAAQLGAIENEWVDAHERGRPDELARGPSASAAQRYASRGHEEEEMRRRFARRVAGWIGEQAREQGFTNSTVFAAMRFGADLKQEVDGNAVDIRDAHLAKVTPGELPRHPAVSAVLEG